MVCELDGPIPMENTSKKLVYMPANYTQQNSKSSRQHGNTDKKNTLVPLYSTKVYLLYMKLKAYIALSSATAASSDATS